MKNGFSLIEVLLVMAMLVILSAIATSSFVGYRNAVEAEEEINKVRSLLHSAQGKAVALEENSRWGVRFSNSSTSSPSYELFKGSSYPGTIKETVYLSPRFKFISPALDGVQDVIFEKRNGRSTSQSDIIITIKPKSGEILTKSVTITREGNIK